MIHSKMESEAADLLKNGHANRAAKKYIQILAYSPDDLRIRQKLAEAHLKDGKADHAEREFRKVGESFLRDKQYRPAIAVYTQLVKLKPNDGELLGHLGECQHGARFTQEARKAYVEAIQLLQSKPKLAARFAQRLLELDPADLAVRVRLAEFHDASGDKQAGLSEWRNLLQLAREAGRMADRARFAKKALSHAPDDKTLLFEAAQAQVDVGDAKAAFPLIQKLYAKDRESEQVLALLASAFRASGSTSKARQVMLELAKLHGKKGHEDQRIEVLKQVLEFGDDPRIRAMIGDHAPVDDPRLGEQPWAQPATEQDVEQVTRTRTLVRYGLAAQAAGELGSVASVAEAVAKVDALVASGQFDAALKQLDKLQPPDDAKAEVEQAVLHIRGLAATAKPASSSPEPAVEDQPAPSAAPDDGAEELDATAELEPLEPELEELPQEAVAAEPLVEPPAEQEADEPASVEPSPEPEPEPEPDPAAGADGAVDEEVDDPESDGILMEEAEPEEDDDDVFDREPESDDEALGDRLAADGDISGAIQAYRNVLNADPSNETILMKIGSLLSGGDDDEDEEDEPSALPAQTDDTPEEPTHDDPSDDIFEHSALEEPITEEVPVQAAEKADESDLELAEALVAVGLFEEALRHIPDELDLTFATVAARAQQGLGRAKAGCRLLQNAVADIEEDHPGYVRAIWQLSGLYVATGKLRAAGRLLDELEDLDSDFRPLELAARRRGIELLKSR